MAAKQELVCTKDQLQQEGEVQPVSSVLASDLVTKLDEEADEREVAKAIKDTSQVRPLVGRKKKKKRKNL